MKGGTQAKAGLPDILCPYCNTLFTPIRARQFICPNDSCKKEHERLYRINTKDRDKDSNKMAEWRRKNPAKRLLSSINQRNNIDIDLEWIQERLDKGICEVTGIPFEFVERYGGKAGFNHFPWNPSIDKVDPNGGYKKSNCQLVVWAYNRAKGIWDINVMKKLAEGMYNGLVK